MPYPLITPIETIYHGIKFRSRLEARWAVFFTALGLDFVYEPDGYDLDGVWYLPDFWIPEWNCFVEIKPEEPPREAFVKCGKLAHLTERRVYLIFGVPSEGKCTAISCYYDKDIQEEGWDDDCCNYEIDFNYFGQDHGYDGYGHDDAFVAVREERFGT
ncbi:MAG: hypothetical protein ACRCT1_14990 [Microcoleaceae cyanobacterium]